MKEQRAEELFMNGKRYGAAGITMVYLPSEQQELLFVAPKKLFPRAVDRNRAKRLMREAWRSLAVTANGRFAFVYHSNLQLAALQDSMRKAFSKI